MADSTKPSEEPDPNAESGRDFGDSAGYGSGGSALDRRDVGDPAESPSRPNPLDEIMDTPPAAPEDAG